MKNSKRYSRMASWSRRIAVRAAGMGLAETATSYRARALQLDKLAKLAKLGTVNA